MKAAIKPRIDLDQRTPLHDVIPLETPFVVFVDPATACNFCCPFCPTGDRELIGETGRFQGLMPLTLYRKLIDDLTEFPSQIKVLRLYKDGEPLLNKHFAEMVSYAKASRHVRLVDTTTNASLLTPERIRPIIAAGLDRINISINGLNDEQYRRFTGFDIDFSRLVDNIRWLYRNKSQCEIVIKIPSELIEPSQHQQFYDIFGDYCDRIFIENFAPCWPEFDVEARTGATITQGIYQQLVQPTETCPYIFYSFSVNVDGKVSACFLDWSRKLIVGDVRKDSLRSIWNGVQLNSLRRLHLEGRRSERSMCSDCGQLTHGMPDNIDAYCADLLKRFDFL
ncbi:radical SAM protein [Allochromatium humboldtianum]|uniref:Radical SAM protein n=1 Tax=Allochromatium humboldtianum TaxID=504901 RepID=A0A850RCZ3_9GAMM|nr:radical SAM/SPASM domain-containing protein [Allochromatium humboldtianum]NVZ11208.1 radical SAM protein [Allochromatium humboldtianum]